MLVKRLRLKNFRNYAEEDVEFGSIRNIVIGENAQGKTNLIEAIEYSALGRSTRTTDDKELIRKGESRAAIIVDFEANTLEQRIEIELSLRMTAGARGPRTALDRKVKINGVSYSSTRNLAGKIVVVGFKSLDLNLLRGGPRYRREWIDDLTSTLKTSYARSLSRFNKAVTQRNRLLKEMFERIRLSQSDEDELKVWDQQVASLGASLVRSRLMVLKSLIPLAEARQAQLSGAREKLSIDYFLHSIDDEDPRADGILNLDEESEIMPEKEIEEKILTCLATRKREEIARRQTLTGPHRDDVRLKLNGFDATAFASQGQQRSLVLSLKLSELFLVAHFLKEPPILLLDDVLAELDLSRQGYLMESLSESMQTIITTTHIDGFKPEWLSGASFLSVHNGRARKGESPLEEKPAGR